MMTTHPPSLNFKFHMKFISILSSHYPKMLSTLWDVNTFTVHTHQVPSLKWNWRYHVDKVCDADARCILTHIAISPICFSSQWDKKSEYITTVDLCKYGITVWAGMAWYISVGKGLGCYRSLDQFQRRGPFCHVTISNEIDYSLNYDG